jgi:hypothetical protein
MKYFSVIAFLLAVFVSSCTKEIITPIQDADEIMDTRGSTRNPENDGNGNGENGGITDPDNESDEEKVRNKKKKAR